MSRIRSVHPGLFTDEQFVSLSPLTRIFLVGLWTECDDHGVFEWKPITLKMKLLGADNANVEELMGNLSAFQIVQEVEIEGRAYGLVRNFCRYQRPKKPSYRVGVPQQFWSYIGLNPDGSVPNHHSSPSSTPPLPPKPTTRPRTRPQMEEGGDKRKEERTSNTTQSINTSVVVLAAEQEKYDDDNEGSNEDLVREAGTLPLPPNGIGTILPAEWVPSTADQEVAASFGMSPTVIETQLLEFHAYNGHRGTLSPNWSATWFRFCSAWQRRQAANPEAKARVELSVPFNPTPDQWHRQITIWQQDQSRWSRQYGPEPGMGGCRCPPLILTAHGIDPRTGLRLAAPGEKPAEAKAS